MLRPTCGRDGRFSGRHDHRRDSQSRSTLAWALGKQGYCRDRVVGHRERFRLTVKYWAPGMAQAGDPTVHEKYDDLSIEAHSVASRLAITTMDH
ncbi:MAG: hypothetical protein H0V35_10065 [Nitrospira sp.]|nr:hypothetical protein [Nitrospira sp.]